MGMKHLLVYAVVLSTAGGCQFGSLPGCVYQCYCENGNPCDPVTGACPDGCDDGDPDGYFSRGAYNGPGCQEGNVAFGQPATVTDGHGRPEPWRAVDGDRTPVSLPSDDACFQLREHYRDDLPSWQVDLGRTHVVKNITMYGKTGFNPWDDVTVEVGYHGIFEQCGSVGLSGRGPRYQLLCPMPLLGRFVRINLIKYYDRIYLCEVYVNGYRFVECSTGVFGPGCLTECHCHTNCDVISGECSSYCDDGWREYNCQAPCGAGTWGPNCNHTCHCMNQNEACHHIDGSCQGSGCARSHVGVGCDAVIPSLNSAPYNLKLISTSRLEFEFRSWQPSQDHGDRPSSYVPQLRMLLDTTWEDMPEIPAGPRAISVRVDYDFEVDATYDVRVIPLLVHEGMDYRGIGQHATFSSDGLLNRENMVSSGAIAGGVVAVLLVVGLVIIVLFLRRHYYKRDVSPGGNRAAVIDTVSISSLTAGDSGSLDHTVSAIEAAEWVVVSGTPYLHEKREPLTRPIRVQELGDYIQDTKSQTNGFQSEFMKIPSGQTAAWSIAERTINMGKNRFNNIMAYDHSRVKLDVSTQDQDQGYINANFIPAYGNGGEGYIAAQGPRVHTIIDTWRMFWQYQVNRIVMLTTIMEEEKVEG